VLYSFDSFLENAISFFLERKTGLDLEMSITDHYIETLEVIHKVFTHIFTGLESRYSKELSVVREQYFSEPVKFTENPCVLHWDEAQSILRERGFDMGNGMEDLSGAMVRFYYILVTISLLISKLHELSL